MQICDIMTDSVVSVVQDEPVTAAARLMKRHNIGALPVCDDERRLRGMITDRDIVLRCIAAEMDPAKTSVNEVMSRGIITAGPFDSIDHAVRLMSKDQVRRLPVLDNGQIVGMVALCDMSRASNCEMEAAEALCEISSNVRHK